MVVGVQELWLIFLHRTTSCLVFPFFSHLFSLLPFPISHFKAKLLYLVFLHCMLLLLFGLCICFVVWLFIDYEFGLCILLFFVVVVVVLVANGTILCSKGK